MACSVVTFTFTSFQRSVNILWYVQLLLWKVLEDIRDTVQLAGLVRGVAEEFKLLMELVEVASMGKQQVLVKLTMNW